MSDENYISLQEATFRTGLKYREVYQLAQAGKIRSRRDEGGNLQLLQADVQGYKQQTASPPARSQTQPPQRMAASAPPVLLQGRYRLEHTLGKKGGYGQVYKAYNQTLGGWRAIKQLIYLPAVDSFRREGRLLEQLDHPSLPKVYDLFEEEGNHYLVMEYIEGNTLSKWVKENGPVAESQALIWTDQVLNALDYLHRQNIIHRDVKPDNIIIQAKTERAVLVDLGIARSGNHTHPGGASPYYSPPEQTGNNVDARYDIYSLGATLYFMLIGHPPLDAADRINNETLVSPCDANPAISANTEQVISKALAVRRDERWPNASAMRRALQSDPPDIPTASTSV